MARCVEICSLITHSYLWSDFLVYGLYILETTQTALCTADAMRWYAIGYGNLLALIKPEFSTIDAPILDAIIAIIVQLTFCWRIRVCLFRSPRSWRSTVKQLGTQQKLVALWLHRLGRRGPTCWCSGQRDSGKIFCWWLGKILH